MFLYKRKIYMVIKKTKVGKYSTQGYLYVILNKVVKINIFILNLRKQRSNNIAFAADHVL